MISVNIKFKNGYEATFNSSSPQQLVVYDLNIGLSNLKLNEYIKDYTIYRGG